jgi:hypothetical protein
MEQINSYCGDLNLLARREVVAELLKDRNDLMVVTGLGAATYDVAAVSHCDHNFYLWGAMGSAAMIGLGLALSSPGRAVLVITAIAVLDNGHYGETGMQKSHSSFGIGLHKVAAACNFAWSEEVNEMQAVAGFRKQIYDIESGPALARILIEANNEERVLPTRDCVEIKNRFRAAQGLSV